MVVHRHHSAYRTIRRIVMQKKHTDDDGVAKKIDLDQGDIFKHTPIRYLGYANEVGESFRSLINVWWVRLSYGIASGYVLADALDKGFKSWKSGTSDITEERDKRKMTTIIAVTDTIIWQSLASVIIPGFTINRICRMTLYLLRRRQMFPAQVQKWTTTAIGLGSIPFIIRPIDLSVDTLMNRTLRQYYSKHLPAKPLVYHSRKS